MILINATYLFALLTDERSWNFNMVQEYLFTNKEHRETIEKYYRQQDNIKLDIEEIENSDCWIAKFSTVKNDEASAKRLSVLNDDIVQKYHPTVLTNDSSAYFNKVLFPYINEFERKLRKLLYLKSALSLNPKNVETIRNLEEKDLGEIFTLLFSDTQFVNSVKKSVNGKTWQFTKAEILESIQNLHEHTLWDDLMDGGAVPTLRSRFVESKGFRNDVMHARNMDKKAYCAAKELIKKINAQLDSEIGKIIVEKETGNKSCSQTSRDFNTLMSNAMKTMDEQQTSATLMEQLSQIQSSAALIDTNGISAALKELEVISNIHEIHNISKYISSSEISAIQQQFQEISKVQENIAPALMELQKLSTTFAEYKINIPRAVIELQKTLDAVKPNPQIIEAAQKICDAFDKLHLDDSLGEKNN